MEYCVPPKVSTGGETSKSRTLLALAHGGAWTVNTSRVSRPSCVCNHEFRVCGSDAWREVDAQLAEPDGLHLLGQAGVLAHNLVDSFAQLQPAWPVAVFPIHV